MNHRKRETSQSSSAADLSDTDQQFRDWFRRLGLWPEEANRLFVHLNQTPQLALPISAKQKQMIKIVIQEVLKHVDVTVRYPAFFRQLLTNATLRQEFMATVGTFSETDYPDLFDPASSNNSTDNLCL